MNLKQWYVVYSKPHMEERAQFHFRLKQVEYFFPPPSSSRHSHQAD